MKYRIGDKVIVRRDLDINKRYFMEDASGSNDVTTEMLELCGKQVEIIDIVYGQYRIDELDYGYRWTDEMFYTGPKELIEPGYIVECRNGSLYLFLNGYFMGANFDTRLSIEGLRDYDDDLHDIDSHNFDIMKIYKSHAGVIKDIFKPDQLSVIWDRAGVKEMTIQEIENELGYSVKIVKGE